MKVINWFKSLFKSKEQKVLDSIVRCCKCGDTGSNDNELIDISRDKYFIVICERCEKDKRVIFTR